MPPLWLRLVSFFQRESREASHPAFASFFPTYSTITMEVGKKTFVPQKKREVLLLSIHLVTIRAFINL